MNTKHKKVGVTLVVIFVIVAMVRLLTMLKNPKAPISIGSGAARSVTVTQIRDIEHALNLYREQNGFYPTTEQGLMALVTKPTTKPQPENYPENGYMRTLPRDAWGDPFIYRCHGEDGPIDIICFGPDGEEGTEDDITNHNRNTISIDWP